MISGTSITSLGWRRPTSLWKQVDVRSDGTCRCRCRYVMFASFRRWNLQLCCRRRRACCRPPFGFYIFDNVVVIRYVIFSTLLSVCHSSSTFSSLSIFRWRSSHNFVRRRHRLAVSDFDIFDVVLGLFSRSLWQKIYHRRHLYRINRRRRRRRQQLSSHHRHCSILHILVAVVFLDVIVFVSLSQVSSLLCYPSSSSSSSTTSSSK